MQRGGLFTSFANFPSKPLRVLQFTDTHFLAEANQTLMGWETSQSFDQVVRRARQQHWPADLVLVTGDLVHDSSTKAYQRLAQRLDSLGIPVYCLPGNHDDPERFPHFLKGKRIQTTERTIRRGNWQILLLDSTVSESDRGHLSPPELACLEEHLAAYPHHYTLVCLHHHPVPIGSPWMDEMAVDNSEALFHILDRYPPVRGILWGHIHQTFDEVRNGVRLLATPSTCFQFKPRSTTFCVDDLPPGYRWLALQPDGTISTDVERLP